MTEERVGELEDRSVEIIPSKQWREKKNEKIERSLRDLWDSNKMLLDYKMLFKKTELKFKTIIQ